MRTWQSKENRVWDYFGKKKVYMEKLSLAERPINSSLCRKIADLKNGEKTFQISETPAKFLVIADKFRKAFRLSKNGSEIQCRCL